MLIKAKTKIGTGVQYALAAADDLIIAKTVTIQSTNTFGVLGEGANQTVTVQGTVVGQDDAIHLTGIKALVEIALGAHVIGRGDDAIELSGANSTVINRGVVEGVYGLWLNFSGPGTAKVVNYGQIFATEDGVSTGLDAGSSTRLENYGTISAVNGESFDGDNANNVIVNTGSMIGNIEFYSGDDVYDGRTGKLFGAIYGGVGNDRFTPGALAETLDGGVGNDTLDFRTTKGIKVDLAGVVANTGVAKGDVYTGIDTVFGALTGKDELLGQDSSNLLKGFGGNDLLNGFDNADTLNGGMGKDTLIGGTGSDFFVFGTVAEGGDKIMDFVAADDTIQIKGKAFGGGLALGVLVEEAFATGTTNKAVEADDRFILNTTTMTLWFDKDGTGTKFKAILVADLNDDASLSFDDIAII